MGPIVNQFAGLGLRHGDNIQVPTAQMGVSHPSFNGDNQVTPFMKSTNSTVGNLLAWHTQGTTPISAQTQGSVLRFDN